MPGIRRKGIGIIYDEPEQEAISYCQRCLKSNVYSILRERVCRIGETLSPSDYDNFKQCHDCGTIVPIYETKKEDKTRDVIEIETNPFDVGKSVVGLDNKKPKDRRQKEREKLLEKIDKEKDEDIKNALRRGNTVEIIQEKEGLE